MLVESEIIERKIISRKQNQQYDLLVIYVLSQRYRRICLDVIEQEVFDRYCSLLIAEEKKNVNEVLMRIIERSLHNCKRFLSPYFHMTHIRSIVILLRVEYQRDN